MELTDYEKINLGIPLESNPERWFANLSQGKASALFDELMAVKEERKEKLKELVSPLELSCEKNSLDALNEWFLEHLEADSGNPKKMTSVWYSIGFDIGLFLGDCLIDSTDKLRWELNKRERFDGQHLPVLGGFDSSKCRDYYYNIVGNVWSVGDRRLVIVNHDQIYDGLSKVAKRLHERTVAKWKGKEHEFGKGAFLRFRNHVLERA